MKINKHCFPNGLRLGHYEDTSTQMVALNIVSDLFTMSVRATSIPSIPALPICSSI